MKKPVEMRSNYGIRLHDGAFSTTQDVWDILNAAAQGDLDKVSAIAETEPRLVSCQFDYTTPLHFAVREGHFEIVRFLVEAGALDPDYYVHPFKVPIVTVADDRGFDEIGSYLRRSLEDNDLVHKWGDTGGVDFLHSETQAAFQNAVDQEQHSRVKEMLADQPDLVLDETAFWGEGILSMPAKSGDFKMVEILIENGASVPPLSKWGARYYFKLYDMAKFLLENGMSPDHMNWREFTLLHDMAFTGDVDKARLLLDNGADIDATDDEFSSTALGYAAYWGKHEMVSLLIEYGADTNKARAPWATPLAWARKKGHARIVEDLLNAGAA